MQVKDCDKMLKKIYNELYVLAGNIYEEYEENLKNEEDLKYNNLDILTLKRLQITLSILLKNSFKYDEYEICLLDDDSIILSRILNKTNLYLDKSAEELNIRKSYFCDLYSFKDDKLTFLSNVYGKYNSLSEKIMADIEMKYMYLLKNDDNMSNEMKNLLSYNLAFINPYIENVVVDNKTNIKEYIKNEDQRYNEMDDSSKYLYDDFIEFYTNYTLNKTISKMLTDKKMSEKVAKINSIFMRSIFLYMNESEIEKLKYKYRYTNPTLVSQNGYECMMDAFQKVESDKELIKKLKN